MTERDPQQILDDIEPALIRAGHLPRKVTIRDDCEAHFWVKKKELWIVGQGSPIQLPYFDPGGSSDERLTEKLNVLLPYA